MKMSTIWLIWIALYEMSCSNTPRPRDTKKSGSLPASAGAFWLFADSQLHAVAGASARSKGWFIDKWISKTAIRPPTLDLWSEAVLAETSVRMRTEAPEIPAFFLGDGVNASCIEEYERFLRVLADHDRWFGVFGNHDGYYMGNMNFSINQPEGDYSWQGVCARDGVASHRVSAERRAMAALERQLFDIPRGIPTYTELGILTKSHAVIMYLKALHSREAIGKDPLAIGSWRWENCTTTNSTSCQPSWVYRWPPLADTATRPTANLKVTARIDGSMYASAEGVQAWRAFLVQDVALEGGSRALLADTSDFVNDPPARRGLGDFIAWSAAKLVRCPRVPTARSIPGVCGEVNDMQTAELLLFLTESPTSRFFVLGHHPFRDLRSDTAKRLAGLFNSQGFITYISGHTHDPIGTMSTGANAQWELNIASTTDWPMQYARVDYTWNPNEHHKAALTVSIKAIEPAESTEACPLSREEGGAAEEMDYKKPDRYVDRALHVLAHAVRLARLKGWSGNLGSCDILVSDQQHSTSKTTAKLPFRRACISTLMDIDRDQLRHISAVHRMEVACAVWASKLENKKNSSAITYDAMIRPAERLRRARLRRAHKARPHWMRLPADQPTTVLLRRGTLAP
jgi:hypothetical protein